MPSDVADSMEADIRAAAESLSSGTAPAVETVEQPAAEVGEPVSSAPESVETTGQAERARDEAGRFAKSEKPAQAQTPDGATAAADRAKPAGEGKPAAAAPAGTPAPVAQAAEAIKQTMKPPQSLNATEREEWGKWPESARKAFDRREREANVRIQQAAEAEKGFQVVRETVAPYEPLLRQMGMHPVQAIKGLLADLEVITSAPAEVKARRLADIVRHSGVTPEMFAAAYDAGPQAPMPQAQHQFSPQTIRPVLREELQAIIRERADQAAAKERAEFEASAPEFWDLPGMKSYVQALIQAAAQEGEKLTYRDAYERATWAHPESAPIMRQRETQKHQQQSTATAAAAMQRKQAAATPKSSPAMAPPPVASRKGNGSMSDDLKAAMVANGMQPPEYV